MQEQTAAGRAAHTPGPREVYLKEDIQERYNLERAWFVKAYRLVDAAGKDAVQPWFTGRGGKRDAVKFALKMGWTVVQPARAAIRRAEGSK